MPDDTNPTPAAPPRELSAILHDLEALSAPGDSAHRELRQAVGELGRALAGLFEAVRTERAEQRVRIAELEAELAAAQARLAGRQPGPAADDFDQLRAAAEQLRASTERLMRETSESATGDAPAPDEDEASDEGEAEVEVEHARPGILKVFPGTGGDLQEVAAEAVAVAQPPRGGELAVENELPVEEEQPGTPTELPGAPADEPAPPADEPAPPADEPAPPAKPPSTPEPILERRGPGRPSSVRRRGEPVALLPRPARPRKRLRRRRIDARKLAGIQATTALRAMVDAVDPLWTAGCPLDLILALTDGATLRVGGGGTEPLRVDDVEPGTRARTTVTLTRDQLVPLFGRLELTDEQSAPLLHGSRRDADLLVAWIDRAQKLAPEPL